MATSKSEFIERKENLNIILAVVFLFLQIATLVLIPLLAVPHNPEYFVFLVIPLLFTNSWWAFIHESIHGSLFFARLANKLAGRVNGLLFGASFYLLRSGHMLHHALSRTPRDRSEVYVEHKDNLKFFSLVYYIRLVGGLYFLELLGGLLLLLPRSWIWRISSKITSEQNMIELLVARVLKEDVILAVRLDEMLILLLYVLSILLYGKYYWVLLLALAVRGFLISIMDNAFHYGTKLGKPESSRNLWLPKWASSMILNFNFHRNHHLHQSVPWHLLPEIENQENASNKPNLLTALVSQFKGPIPESDFIKR